MNVPEDRRPKIVCLCGSTRFASAFEKAGLEETINGRIVVSIGCNLRDDEVFKGLLEDELSLLKDKLDKLHKWKIWLADEVLFLNVDGYIGSSTRSELRYAISQEKLLRFLEPRYSRKNIRQAIEERNVADDFPPVPRLLSHDDMQNASRIERTNAVAVEKFVHQLVGPATTQWSEADKELLIKTPLARTPIMQYDSVTETYSVAPIEETKGNDYVELD